MGDQKNQDQQNPGFTDQEKKRENERAGQNPYDKDQASNPERQKKQDPQLIRATSKTILIARPLDRGALVLHPPVAWRGSSLQVALQTRPSESPPFGGCRNTRASRHWTPRTRPRLSRFVTTTR